MTSGRRAAQRAEKQEKSLLQYIGMMLGIVLVLTVLFLGAILVVVPKVAGATPLAVLTGSMKPGLPPGTLIIIQPVATNDIRIGDVITYQIRSGEPDVITHRVISIATSGTGERSFTLQGDNNAVADLDPIKPVQVQGRLWYSVPYVGYASTALNGEARSWFVPVAAAGLLAYAGYMFASGIVGAAKKRRMSRASAAQPVTE